MQLGSSRDEHTVPPPVPRRLRQVSSQACLRCGPALSVLAQRPSACFQAEEQPVTDWWFFVLEAAVPITSLGT